MESLVALRGGLKSLPRTNEDVMTELRDAIASNSAYAVRQLWDVKRALPDLSVWTSPEFQRARDDAIIRATQARSGNLSLLLFKGLINYMDGDVNWCGNDGCNALHWAAWERQPEMVEFLLKTNVNLYHIDKAGRSILTDSFQACHPSVLRSVLHAAPSLIDARDASILVSLMGRSHPHLLHDTLRARETLKPFAYDDAGLAAISSQSTVSAPIHTLLQCGIYPGTAELAGKVVLRATQPYEFLRYLLAARECGDATLRAVSLDSLPKTSVAALPKPEEVPAAAAVPDPTPVVDAAAQAAPEPSADPETAAAAPAAAAAASPDAAGAAAVDTAAEGTAAAAAAADGRAPWELSAHVLVTATQSAIESRRTGVLTSLLQLGAPVSEAWAAVANDTQHSSVTVMPYARVGWQSAPEGEMPILALITRPDFDATAQAQVPVRAPRNARSEPVDTAGDFASDDEYDSDDESPAAANARASIEGRPDPVAVTFLVNGWSTAAAFAFARGAAVNTPQGRRDLRRIRQARALQPYLFRQTFRPENLGSLAVGGTAHAHPHAAPVMQPKPELSAAERAAAEHALAKLTATGPPARWEPLYGSPLGVAVARALRPTVGLLVAMGAADTSPQSTFVLGSLLQQCASLPRYYGTPQDNEQGDALYFATTLVERGARVSYPFTPDSEAMEQLFGSVRYGPQSDSFRRIAFPVLCHARNAPVLRALLCGRGLLINQRNEYDDTALAIAVGGVSEDPSALIALIEAGASVVRDDGPRVRNRAGQTTRDIEEAIAAAARSRGDNENENGDDDGDEDGGADLDGDDNGGGGDGGDGDEPGLEDNALNEPPAVVGLLDPEANDAGAAAAVGAEEQEVGGAAAVNDNPDLAAVPADGIEDGVAAPRSDSPRLAGAEPVGDEPAAASAAEAASAASAAEALVSAQEARNRALKAKLEQAHDEGRLMVLPLTPFDDVKTYMSVLVTLIGRAAVETGDTRALGLLRKRVLTRAGADYFNVMPNLTRDIMRLSEPADAAPAPAA